MVKDNTEEFMAETVESRKLELLNHLQCIICLGDVNEARLCPRCSKLFCDPCIKSWLNKSTSCPVCRATVQYDSLVRGCLINQILESIKLLFSSMVTKAEILKELNDEKQQIEKQSEELLAGKVNPGTVTQIVEIDQEMANLRLNHQNETSPMHVYERSEFMSEPTTLVFSMNDLSSRIYNRGSCCTYLQAPYGFEWQCELLDGGEEDALSLYLCLITGKPSEYSVLFGNEQKKVFRFELGCALKIGVYKPVVNVDNDTHEITLQICQSKADKIQHLQDFITRLEKDLQVALNVSHDSFGNEKRKKVVNKETDTHDLTENNQHFDADRIQQLQDCVARLKKEDAEHVSYKALFHQLGKAKRNWPLFRLKWIVTLGLILMLILLYEHLDSDALSCQLRTLEPVCPTWFGCCSVVSCVKWLYDQCYNWRND